MVSRIPRLTRVQVRDGLTEYFCIWLSFSIATGTFCTQMTCKNGGTCVPFSLNEPSCNIGQISSTCCQCKGLFVMMGERVDRGVCSRSTEFYWFALWTRCVDCLEADENEHLILELDFCASNPCKANGRCLADQSGYRCECSDGYTGENCDGNLSPSPSPSTHTKSFFSSSNSSRFRLCIESLLSGYLLSIESEWTVVCLHLSGWNSKPLLQFHEYVEKCNLLMNWSNNEI